MAISRAPCRGRCNASPRHGAPGGGPIRSVHFGSFATSRPCRRTRTLARDRAGAGGLGLVRPARLGQRSELAVDRQGSIVLVRAQAKPANPPGPDGRRTGVGRCRRRLRLEDLHRTAAPPCRRLRPRAALARSALDRIPSAPRPARSALWRRRCQYRRADSGDSQGRSDWRGHPSAPSAAAVAPGRHGDPVGLVDQCRCRRRNRLAPAQSGARAGGRGGRPAHPRRAAGRDRPCPPACRPIHPDPRAVRGADRAQPPARGRIRRAATARSRLRRRSPRPSL